MVKEVVVGVVGAGVFGGYHAQKYANIPGVRFAAVHDIDARKAADLARAYNAAPYTNYDEFLGAVEAMTIAAPATAHYELARRALESGCHVLIEKPIALRLDHADRLIELADQGSLVVQAGHQERFVFDSFGILARTSKPRSVLCRRCNPPSGRGEDVSVIFDLMIHDLDLVRRLDLGLITSIAAKGDANEIDVEVAFEGGGCAVFESSRRADACDRRMTLVYDDGIIEVDFLNRVISNSTATPLPLSLNGMGHSQAFGDPLGYGVARFVDAVRGEAAPAIPASDGRAAVEWALLVSEAAEATADRDRAPLRARA